MIVEKCRMLILACLVSGNISLGQHIVYHNISPQRNKILNDVVLLMHNNAYDSAQALIFREILDQNKTLTHHEEYYFYSYESEIMYYNALFDIGLASAERCLAIARTLKNDTLIGSAENLLGLQLMHLNNYGAAKKSFREAVKLLPPKTNSDLYSQRYHALANLAEVYLYQQKPDSASYYSALAVNEASAQSRVRGVAFAYWSWAEAEILKGQVVSAKALAKRGLAWLEREKVGDAALFLNLTLMKVFHLLDQSDSTAAYQAQAEKLMGEDSTAISDFAKLTYLDILIDFYLEHDQPSLAIKELTRERALQSRFLQRQEHQRLVLRESIFNNKEAINIANLKAEAQQRELKLKNALNIFFGSLLLVGALALFVGSRNIRHKQRILKLQHQHELKNEHQRMELEALKARFEAVDAERNRIAADLHDEIGAALSSIHIYSNVAQKKMSQKQDHSDLVEKINVASAGLLERMSDIIWSINPEHQTLLDLKLRIRSFAADLLFPLGIQVEYIEDASDDNLKISVMARKNLYLCYKELINNIAKYSKAAKTTIGLRCTNEILEGWVSDDGVGFEPLKNTHGNGLRNIQQRIKLMGGEYSYSSETSKGVLFNFKVGLTNISD